MMTSTEPPSRRLQLRRFWVQTHKWAGLLSALFLFALCLSGIAITWKPELTRLTSSELFAASFPAPDKQSLPIEDILTIATKAAPLAPQNILPPRREQPVWVVQTVEGQGYQAKITNYMLDPTTGQVLGNAHPREGFLAFLTKLHHTLLLPFGKEGVGFFGGLLLLSAASGIYLWWPKSGRFWRSVRWQSATPLPRLLLDLHNSFGFWSLTVVVVIAFTGLTMGYMEITRNVVALFSTVSAPPQKPGQHGPGQGQGNGQGHGQGPEQTASAGTAPAFVAAVSPSQAIRLAEEALPGYRVISLGLPSAASGLYRASLNPPFYASSERTRGTVTIDAQNGAIRDIRSPSTQSAGDLFLGEQIWLHYGLTFGTVGRVIASLAGLAPMMLAGTGVWIWARKKRIAAARRQQEKA